MKLLRLIFPHGVREWRHLDVQILAVALIIAVAAVTMVDFFADRMQRLIQEQSAEILGADVRLSASYLLPISFLEQAQQLGLQTAETRVFSNVLLFGENTVLTEVKAVSAHYPLRGQLQIAEGTEELPVLTTEIPPVGKIWVDPTVLNQLGIKIGEIIQLGELQVTVDKVLLYEPDRGNLWFQLSPRVLMNLEDLPATQLVGVGSRVKYYGLIAGESSEKIASYIQWVNAQSQPGLKVEEVQQGVAETQALLDKAQQFLGLSALVVVLLSGAAIAMALYQFAHRQLADAAIMRCLGATQALITRFYLGRLMVIGLVASIIGTGFGWILQQGLAWLLGNYLSNSPLPNPSLQSLWVGLITGMVALFGFGLPPLLRIRQAAPLQVLRGQWPPMSPAVWEVMLLATLAMGSLIVWQAQDGYLASWMIFGTLLTIALSMGGAWLLVKGLRGYEHWPLTWRLAAIHIVRNVSLTSLQIAALGIGIMAILLLFIIRTQLLETWQQDLPANTPNYFAANIQSTQLPEFKTVLQKILTAQDSTATVPAIYPLIRGQLVTINGRPLSTFEYSSARAKRLAERTFNLTYSLELPPHNQLVAGQFWTHPTTPEFSIEQELAADLNIQLGDTLEFVIAGETLSAPVTSLRTVKWDSFQLNFFVLASPIVLEQSPQTYATSFYFTPASARQVPQLIQRFPGITFIDVNALLNRLRHTIDRMSLAVQYLFWLNLLAGLTVLMAALSSTQPIRLHETLILRALGATRFQVLSRFIVELAVIGGLAGILGALLASGIGYGITTTLMEMTPQFSPSLILITGLSSMLSISLLGTLVLLTGLKQPPLRQLHSSQ